MKSLCRPFVAVFILASLFAASCSSCDSCGSEKPPAETAEPDVAVAEPDVVEDTYAEKLEEAKKNARVLGDQAAFDRVTKARFMAAELEGMEKKVEGPKVKGTTHHARDNGTIDVQKVRRVFNEHNGALQNCYERALKRDPALQGKVTLTVRIGGSGEATLVKARSNAINDRGALSCMEREVKGWLFPAPQGGTVLLNKPIRFTPKN